MFRGLFSAMAVLVAGLLLVHGLDAQEKADHPKGKSTDKNLVLNGHTGEVLAVAFQEGGNRLVSLSMSKGTKQYERVFETKLWDTTTGKEVSTYSQSQVGEFYLAALSPDGKRFALITRKKVGKPDPHLDIFDVGSGRNKVSIQTSGKLGGGAGGIVFSPDGSKLLMFGQSEVTTGGISHEETFLTLLNADTGNVIGKAKGEQREIKTKKGKTLTIQDLGPPIQRAGFSPDGKRIVTGMDVYFGSLNGVARQFDIWDTSTLQRTSGFKVSTKWNSLNQLSFFPDGRKIAWDCFAGVGGELIVFDVGSGDVVHRMKREAGDGHFVIASPPSGKFFVMGGKHVEVVNPSSWSVTSRIETSSLVKTKGTRTGLLPSRVSCLAISQDETRIAWGCIDTVVISNVQTSE